MCLCCAHCLLLSTIMKNKFLLTVIVPCLNSANTISATITSLLPIAKHIQLIVVDGGSTDGTLNILSSFEDSFLKYQVMCTPPRGVYDAMNEAIPSAEAEYIYFLNSDDVVNSDTIIKLKNHLVEADHDMIICAMNYQSRKGLIKSFSTFAVGDKFPSVSHQQIIFRKSMYDLFGLYHTNLRISADYEFFCRIQIYLNNDNYLAIKNSETNILTTFYQGGLSSKSKFSDQLALFHIEVKISVWRAAYRLCRNTLYQLINRLKGR